MARIKINIADQSRAERKIRETKNKIAIEKISKKKRVLPSSFLTLFKWNDGWEIRGRTGKDILALECDSLDEAITFIRDNI
jgi:hypothetical protein